MLFKLWSLRRKILYLTVELSGERRLARLLLRKKRDRQMHPMELFVMHKHHQITTLLLQTLISKNRMSTLSSGL